MNPLFLSLKDWQRKVSQRVSCQQDSSSPKIYHGPRMTSFMGKQELDNLVKLGTLKVEAASRKEFEGMLASARRGLADAQSKSIETDSQFDLAYGAAHRFALAALRQQGYRSDNRVTVFQTLVHTLGTGNADIQIFLRAHNERNLAEYEGRVDIDEKLLADLIRCTKKLETEVGKLTPPGVA